MRTLIYKVDKSQTTEFRSPFDRRDPDGSDQTALLGSRSSDLQGKLLASTKNCTKKFYKKRQFDLRRTEKLSQDKTSILVCYMENQCAEK